MPVPLQNPQICYTLWVYVKRWLRENIINIVIRACCIRHHRCSFFGLLVSCQYPITVLLCLCMSVDIGLYFCKMSARRMIVHEVPAASAPGAERIAESRMATTSINYIWFHASNEYAIPAPADVSAEPGRRQFQSNCMMIWDPWVGREIQVAKHDGSEEKMSHKVIMLKVSWIHEQWHRSAFVLALSGDVILMFGIYPASVWKGSYSW